MYGSSKSQPMPYRFRYTVFHQAIPISHEHPDYQEEVICVAFCWPDYALSTFSCSGVS